MSWGDFGKLKNVKYGVAESSTRAVLHNTGTRVDLLCDARVGFSQKSFRP